MQIDTNILMIFFLVTLFMQSTSKNGFSNYRNIISNSNTLVIVVVAVIIIVVVHYYSRFLSIEIENVHICNEDDRNNYYETTAK